MTFTKTYTHEERALACIDAGIARIQSVRERRIELHDSLEGLLGAARDLTKRIIEVQSQ